MGETMAVMLNGAVQLEYHRDRTLTAAQSQYLESMDARMAHGINLGGQMIRNPDIKQKAQFVALQLYFALKAGHAQQSGAMCSFLALRLPNLKQVKLQEHSGQVLVDLVFDQDYENQIRVDFHKPN